MRYWYPVDFHRAWGSMPPSLAEASRIAILRASTEFGRPVLDRYPTCTHGRHLVQRVPEASREVATKSSKIQHSQAKSIKFKQHPENSNTVKQNQAQIKQHPAKSSKVKQKQTNSTEQQQNTATFEQHIANSMTKHNILQIQ